MRIFTRSFMLLFAFLALTITAGASTIDYACITNNSGSCNILASQLTGTVIWDGTSNFVTYTFTNPGPLTSTIAEIYWDAPVLSGINQIFMTTGGPQFSLGGTPPNLPGGNAVGFHADYLISAQNPSPHNGINPGEFLSVNVNIANMNGFTLSSLNNVQVGLHVQSYGNADFSESLIGTTRINFGCSENCGGNEVPEPSTFWLLGSGLLIGLSFLLRKRNV